MSFILKRMPSITVFVCQRTSNNKTTLLNRIVTFEWNSLFLYSTWRPKIFFITLSGILWCGSNIIDHASPLYCISTVYTIALLRGQLKSSDKLMPTIKICLWNCFEYFLTSNRKWIEKWCNILWSLLSDIL